MGLAEISIIHHVALVLLLLWILASIGWCHPFAFFASLLYLYKVMHWYVHQFAYLLVYVSLCENCAYRYVKYDRNNLMHVKLNSILVQIIDSLVVKCWTLCN